MKARRLPLPLHCYDEAGIIKPPAWLYWLLLFVCIDWVVLVFSLALREHTTQLLGLFYPAKSQLAMQLAATVPFIVVLLLLGNRQRLWQRQQRGWAGWIKPAIAVGVLFSLASSVWQIAAGHWQFQFLQAVKLLLVLLLGTMLIRSHHLQLMVSDWRSTEQA